ncbi:hypothetical protein ACNF42_05815 [Cuniculiplasma sp. SKW3]|uniref:hypothetical protein n=1 Tax=unclassified Cuniculiplasma TaxID=2619706 RepID=UPI003FD4D4C9
MGKPEIFKIQGKIIEKVLKRTIRNLERISNIISRLLFIRYRYEGDHVEKASRKLGTKNTMGYSWQKRQNH